MAKKGVQLTIEVETEDQWNELIKKEGLIVCDIYSDWCGPCNSMAGNLRKLKLEIGGETLILAQAKNDHIECLQRFREKSVPTWMFISGGYVIKLIFGLNTPRLLAQITEEIKNEREAQATKTPRIGIMFDELTPEEQEALDEDLRVKEEEERIKHEKNERIVNERREAVVENLIENLQEYIFVILWPHVTNEQTNDVFGAMKDGGLSVAPGRPVQILLNDENIYEMFYYCTWDYDQEAFEELKTKPVNSLLFQADEECDAIRIALKVCYGEKMHPPGDEESYARRFTVVKQAEIKKESNEDVAEKKLVTKEESKHSLPELEGETSPQMYEYEIPGLYVPNNDKSKAIAMRILFPQIVYKFDLPEPTPIPPHCLVAFDANKRNDVLQLQVEYPEETIRLGYFTTIDPNTATLIAKTTAQYEKIFPLPPRDAKLLVQVSNKKSEPLLSYALLGPLYVSPNPKTGEMECLKLFPDDYDEEEEIEEDMEATAAIAVFDEEYEEAAIGKRDYIEEIGDLVEDDYAALGIFAELEGFTEPIDTDMSTTTDATQD